MTNILPTLYLTLLVSSLCLAVFFLIGELIKRKNREYNFNTLQKRVNSKRATSKEYYSIGVIYLSKKLFDQAVINFSEALRIWDKSDLKGLANLYNTIGFTYFESDQFDISIYYYKEAISISPEYTVALNNLGYAYEKKNMLSQALETYREVTVYDKYNSIALDKILSLKNRVRTRDDRI